MPTDDQSKPSPDQPARDGDTHAVIDGVLYVRVSELEPAQALQALVASATERSASTDSPELALRWLEVAKEANAQHRQLTTTRIAKNLEAVVDALL